MKTGQIKGQTIVEIPNLLTMAKSLELILDDLESEDEFNIITFGKGDPQTFRPGLENRANVVW